MVGSNPGRRECCFGGNVHHAHISNILKATPLMVGWNKKGGEFMWKIKERLSMEVETGLNDPFFCFDFYNLVRKACGSYLFLISKGP